MNSVSLGFGRVNAVFSNGEEMDVGRSIKGVMTLPSISPFLAVGGNCAASRPYSQKNTHGAALRWRALWGFQGRGGLVVLTDGEVQAWVHELGHAERWCPGSVALDESGASWVALGSDGAGGAVMWLANDLIVSLRCNSGSHFGT